MSGIASLEKAQAPGPSVAQVVDTLLQDFAASAVERDKAGGTAKRERDLLRGSGLLSLTIATELGGLGADMSAALDITRKIARIDSSLAHLFAFHHFMLATLQLFGPRAQWAPLHRDTAAKSLFWGNALNPLDRTTFIEPRAGQGEFLVNGTKNFSSGATDSDMLIISALRTAEPRLVVAAIPTSRPGITIHNDWDNIGQRQTDSGSVSFKNVAVLESEILRHPGPLGSPFASLRSSLGQLILANIYLGIAEGAMQEASRYVATTARPWHASVAEHAAEDAYIQHHFGEYWVEAAAARALTDIAQQQFQHAFDQGDAVTEATRGSAAIAIATAKVAATRAALNIASRIFDDLGARATTAKLGFDRFWRNARTHTLHDPVDYKLKELGAWAISGRIPEPSFYS